MPASASISISWSFSNASGSVYVGDTLPSVLSVVASADSMYYYENVTVVVLGTGIFTNDIKDVTFTLRQPGLPSLPSATLVSVHNNSRLVLRLQNRLPRGALFFSARLANCAPSPSVPIGFYTASSIFDELPTPSGVDLTFAPKVVLTLTGTAGTPLQDGPSLSLVDTSRDIFARQVGLTRDDFFTKISFTPNDTATQYTMTVYFTSTEAANAYNAYSLSSNTTIVENVTQELDLSEIGRFQSSWVQSTLAVDASWPYLSFGIAASQGRPTAPTTAELQGLSVFLAAFWQLESSDFVIVSSRATQSADDFEITIYFRTNAAKQYFDTQKLPDIVAVSNNILDLITASTNDEFRARFLRASSTVNERQIDVSWPWIKFLLQPNQTSTSTLVAPASVKAKISSAIVELFGLTNSNAVMVQFLKFTQKKRDASDPQVMTVFFTTKDARDAMTNFNVPWNASANALINALVSRETAGTFNSTYLGSSVASPSAQGAVLASGFAEWKIGAIVAAAAVFLIIVIVAAVVVYKRRFRALENAKRAAQQLPAGMAQMFSIKASDLHFGRKIGEGSFGAVFEGDYNGHQVAIKRLQASMLAAQVNDFFRESSLMMSIPPHRNVVHIFGLCQEFGNYSMVMEYVDGGSLDSFVKRTGSNLSNEHIYTLTRGIALGMRHLARNNIVHRDLAARNILVDSNLVPRIADFGFSRVVDDSHAGKTNSTIGPIRWMSPENLRTQVYSEKSDVWAFGASLLEIVTGDEPFPGSEQFEVAVWVRDGTYTALDFVPDPEKAPKWLLELVRICFAFDAGQRPSFSDIIEYLNQNVPKEVEIAADEEAPVATFAIAPKQRLRGKSNATLAPDSPQASRSKYVEMEPL